MFFYVVCPRRCFRALYQSRQFIQLEIFLDVKMRNFASKKFPISNLYLNINGINACETVVTVGLAARILRATPATKKLNSCRK